MSRLQLATGQIIDARNYTLGLIEDVKPDDWFRLPAGGVTHIAWQVGHLAFGEYALALKRTRGVQPGDDALMPDAFIKRFGKGSEPSADVSSYPSIKEIRAVFDRVHEQTLAETSAFTEAQLDEAVPPPAHPAFTTKLGALLYCARHEALHAGQIGLLRRILGYRFLR